MAFVEDSLLEYNVLEHHGEDEELSPSLEILVVLTRLRLIHTELPKFVKQRYGTELRARILASIKPEISQALTSLLDEIRATDDAKVMRSAVTPFAHSNSQLRRIVPRAPGKFGYRQKSCPLASRRIVVHKLFLEQNKMSYTCSRACSDGSVHQYHDLYLYLYCHMQYNSLALPNAE